VSGSATVQSDYRFRGYSLSGGEPAASVSLSYDHRSGAYANLTVIGAIDEDDDPALLGAIGNLGYARRVSPRVSVEAGVIRADYRRRFGRGSSGFTEFYAGASTRGLSARIYFSPDYYRHNVSTLYGEVEGSISPGARFQLSGHVGVLAYVETPTWSPDRPARYDWRVTLSRPVGPFDLHASVSDAGPDARYTGYYGGLRQRSRPAVVVGASWAF
jgi:uncharacterized protein (TIGR02001 family)